jgi:hypothetical protein
MIDVEAIALAFTGGQHIRAIAEAHGLSVGELLAVLDAEAERCFSGEDLRRQWLAQSRRLEAVERLHFIRAMRGDADSAVIFLRAAEQAGRPASAPAPPSTAFKSDKSRLRTSHHALASSLP